MNTIPEPQVLTLAELLQKVFTMGALSALGGTTRLEELQDGEFMDVQLAAIMELTHISADALNQPVAVWFPKGVRSV